MNRRKTIVRPFSLGRLFGRQQNRRLKAKASPRQPVDVRGLLRGLGRVALVGGKVLALLLLLAGVGFGGYAGYRRVMSSTYFTVQRLEVQAARRASAAEIVRLMQAAKGRNIFTVDLSALRRNVLAHPWVKDAQIERELPGTLRVAITEHKARALLLMGHLYLVNDEGEVFKRVELDEAEGLPVITGIARLDFLNQPQAVKPRLRQALAYLDRYYSQVRPRLAELHLGERGEVTMVMERGGVAVRMGTDVTDERLQRLDAVWAALGPEVGRARILFLDNETRKDRATVRMGNYH